MKTYYKYPEMVIAQPTGEAPILAIAFKEQYICCCCGGVYEKDEVTVLQELGWYNIVDELIVPAYEQAIHDFCDDEISG